METDQQYFRVTFDDGITVRLPAQLLAERVMPDEFTPGSGLVITRPDGSVERK